MRAVITNDDGIAAPGLRWLAWAAYEHGMDVVVAAPNGEASGMSAALSAVAHDGKVLFERTVLPDLPAVPAFSVSASPSYITVLAGLGVFGPAPDVVLSGINRGANAGRAILHSGTVGAALTAAASGARAMAVSLDVLTAAQASTDRGGATLAAIDEADDEARNWSSAADLVRQLLPWLESAPPGTLLNLNVPDRPPAEIAGLRRASIASFGQVSMAIAEVGTDYVRTALKERAADHRAGTDVSSLAEGFATVTPVRPLAVDDDVTLPIDLATVDYSQ